jgi:GABA(A) receptor-associated protein
MNHQQDKKDLVDRKSFKEKYTLEKRTLEADRILKKYPDRIPVIVESSKDSNLPTLDKNKYLVPSDISIGQFMYVIRKRISLTPEQAMFIFVNNQMPVQTSVISQVYKEHKGQCGFLYMTISGESTFG